MLLHNFTDHVQRCSRINGESSVLFEGDEARSGQVRAARHDVGYLYEVPIGIVEVHRKQRASGAHALRRSFDDRYSSFLKVLHDPIHRPVREQAEVPAARRRAPRDRRRIIGRLQADLVVAET